MPNHADDFTTHAFHHWRGDVGPLPRPGRSPEPDARRSPSPRVGPRVSPGSNHRPATSCRPERPQRSPARRSRRRRTGPAPAGASAGRRSGSWSPMARRAEAGWSMLASSTAGMLRSSLDQPLVEVAQVLAAPLTRSRGPTSRKVTTPRAVEPGVEPEEARQRPRGEPRGNHQDQGQRHLCHDQHHAEPVLPARHPRVSLAHRLVEVRPRPDERRHQPEQQRTGDRGSERETRSTRTFRLSATWSGSEVGRWAVEDLHRHRPPEAVRAHPRGPPAPGSRRGAAAPAAPDLHRGRRGWPARAGGPFRGPGEDFPRWPRR